jgi:phosphate/phosphite/phosphonate ABC transporter binding protein
MAVVYKVWDERRSTYLAMKLLQEDLAVDRVFLRRFKREAQTLSRLQHPNIVRFYGLEQDGPHAFLLMDYVDGKSLKREIFDAGGPLDPERVIEIMRLVCSALSYAHNEGMVHCDVKPGNVMIETSGRVLVADFGIARMTDAATATMVGFGTPAYMAPELVRGQEPEPQSDIYALGVILFEMLTGGERPFTGEKAEITGSTSDKVRWEQVNLEPPSPREWNKAINPEMEAVVRKCLAKQPRERYGSVMELMNALAAAVGEKVSAVAPEPMAEKAVKVPVKPSERAAIARRAEAVASEPSRRKTKPWVWLVGAGGVVIAVLVAVGLSLGGGGGKQTPTPSVPATAPPMVIPASSSSPEPSEAPGLQLGSAENPIVWVIATYGSMEDVAMGAEVLVELLHEETALYFEALLVDDDGDVIDAMCGVSESAHMAAMSAFPYLHAHALGCAEAALVSVRYGSPSYNGQFIVRADSGIRDLHGLEGGSFCRPDSFSLSGWIIPWLEMLAAGVDVDSMRIIDALGHDRVVISVYVGDCDAGSTYLDARSSVDDELPDVMEVIDVIAVTTDIPNDGVQYIPAVSHALRDQINAALLNIAATESGAILLEEMFWWSEIMETDHSFYVPVQILFEDAGVSPEDLLRR